MWNYMLFILYSQGIMREIIPKYIQYKNYAKDKMGAKIISV